MHGLPMSNWNLRATPNLQNPLLIPPSKPNSKTLLILEESLLMVLVLAHHKMSFRRKQHPMDTPRQKGIETLVSTALVLHTQLLNAGETKIQENLLLTKEILAILTILHRITRQ